MSLTVYLEGESLKEVEGDGIFIRKDGQTIEIPIEEWHTLCPGQEPVTVKKNEQTNIYYHANITHNLGNMADEADIYKYLWRPEECEDIKKAGDLVQPLLKGLIMMLAQRERFETYNPKNGWGDYNTFVTWISKYIYNCLLYPNSRISVSR